MTDLLKYRIFKLQHNTKDAIPGNIIVFEKLNKLFIIFKKLKISLYFNFDPEQLRNLNLDRFLKKKSNVPRIFHILHKSKITERRFHSVIFNSMSTKFSTNLIDNSINRFIYLQQHIKFKENYNINNKGNIIIYCNNPNGYYKEWINYHKQIPNLVKSIRKYNTLNKIVIRFHRKHSKNDIKNLMIKLKNIDNDIEMDDSEFSITIKDAYCIFIQNASIIIDYINEGIPLFNPNFIPFNDYEGCYNDIIYIKKLKNYVNKLIDRKKFLIKAYNYIIFDVEYSKNMQYVFNFYKKNILYLLLKN